MIVIVLQIFMTDYMFNMFENQIKDVHLVEDLHLFFYAKISQLTKCCTNVNILMSLLDNESFFLQNKFIMISTEIDCYCP